MENDPLSPALLTELTRGLARLPYDYAGRVRRALAESLGPFGGREADLAALDAWLAAPKAPACRLLSGPGGRGKSALLAHWAQNLAAQGPSAPAIAFVPISLRFRTHQQRTLLAVLAARLAFLTGEPLPAEASGLEAWRCWIAACLARPHPDGRPLLVILDGLDEAADWEPKPGTFSPTPGSGVRIIAAARDTAGAANATAWLHRLGWDESGAAKIHYLERLTPAGTAEILEKMEPPLPGEAAVLHRLSEGEPLLIHLYAAGVPESEAPVSSLPTAPGLSGYLADWRAKLRERWRGDPAQREAGLQAALNLLAVARGPLRPNDLLALAPEIDRHRNFLDEILRALAPLTAPAGDSRGMGFRHPRLAEYFSGRLSRTEREVWEGRFLRWGKRTLEALETGDLSPDQVPAYCVEFYGVHLQRAGAGSAEWTALTRPAWRAAWERLEGTDGGFFNGVARAWQAAEQGPLNGLELRCALWESAHRTRPAEIPIELLIALVMQGIWNPRQGLAHAVALPAPADRAAALAGLAPHLPPGLLSEALAAARDLPEVAARIRALAGLATPCPPEEQEAILHEALAAVRELPSDRERAIALADLTPGLPPTLAAAAQEYAAAFRDPALQAQALAGLAPHLPDVVLRRMLTAAHTIPWEAIRAEVLSRLIPALPEKLRREAVAAARTLKDKTGRARTLARLAPYAPPAEREGLFREALATARSIQDAGYRAETLAGLAEILPPFLAAEAVVAAQALDPGPYRTVALVGLAGHLPPDLRIEVLPAVRRLSAPPVRARALTHLAGCLPFEEDPDRRRALLQEAWNALHSTGDSAEPPPTELRSGLTADPASDSEAAPETAETAWLAACEIEDRPSRLRALARIIPSLCARPPESLNAAWHSGLRRLACRPLPELLADLGTLAPLIAHLGGVEAATETLQAIQGGLLC